ncbi:hypothetical protein [Paraburkholderia aromaticivorans]|uniref:Uncharacterized protein n=1 Tax=Paraburkholderia aromaticivorans TaxID=2026199 RepID=A0A248VHR2_9BURK|nr:hypothetical protein [Paraburkholderia aromaticivorans]ASV98402.1 hypothetical protein CJU94_09585 [Paraburkholderia aromaticivorans]
MAESGDSRAGGSRRKNLLRALDGSLKQFDADHIDLSYDLHTWDRVTQIDAAALGVTKTVRQKPRVSPPFPTHRWAELLFTH